MTAIYDFLLHVSGTAPAWLIACLLAWAVSISVTQPLKFLMPLSANPALREWIAQGAAFLSAFFTVAYLVKPPVGILLGVVVGIWSPVAFYLLMRVLERRFPWAADILSGDVRGTLFERRRRDGRP